MSIKHTILALLVPCIMGFGFVIAKPAMEFFPPILLNGLRWTISGLILFWFFPFPKKYFRQIFFVGLIGCTIQYSLTFYGLKIVDAASATLFIQAEIPFGILIAFIVLGERPRLKNILGLIIAFLGLLILSGSPNLNGKFLGVVLLLSGAFTWAFAQVLAKPISQKISAIALTAWIGIISGPQSIIVSFFLEGNTLEYLYNANLQSWLILIYLAAIMNAIGYSLWYFVLGKYPVNYVMPVLLLFPITGLLTAIFLLGESLNTYSYIGGSIIIIGVAIILIDYKIKNNEFG